MNTYVFAYGMLMQPSMLRYLDDSSRGGCQPVTRAVLWNYDLAFDVYATVEYKSDGMVWGLVLDVTAECLAAMDRVESVNLQNPRGRTGLYRRERKEVKLLGLGSREDLRVMAEVYIKNVTDRSRRQPPTATYINGMRESYTKWKLPLRKLENSLVGLEVR